MEEISSPVVKGIKRNMGSNFDIIGISYYPFFSPNTTLEQVGDIINELIFDHGKEAAGAITCGAIDNGVSIGNALFFCGRKLTITNAAAAIPAHTITVRENIDEAGFSSSSSFASSAPVERCWCICR